MNKYLVLGVLLVVPNSEGIFPLVMWHGMGMKLIWQF